MKNLVNFSIHATERYVERVKPALSYAAAQAELNHLARIGQVAAKAPDWLDHMEVEADTVAFLVAGDVVMPLIRGGSRSTYCATTVLVPGGIPEATRASRNRSRARRGGRKRAAKNSERRHGKRAESRVRLDGYATPEPSD